MNLEELNLDRNLYKTDETTDTDKDGAVSSSSSITPVPVAPVPSGATANDINTNSKAIIADRIDSGIITSKQITLGVIPGGGDSYFAAGKTDFNNVLSGFILGVDDTDDKGKFYIGDSSSYLNWDGTSLSISGNISATTGTIGGFTIGATALYAGTGATRIQLDTTQGIFLGSDDISTAPFKISLAGLVTSVGGIFKTAMNVGLGNTGVIMDSAGLRGYDAILGETFNLPTDGSAPSFSSGIINSSIFNINTNSIIRTSATVGDGTANSAGILINDTGLYGLAANQTPTTANIRILTDGTAVFNASIRGGQTDFNSGTGYFLGYSGGDYKFSIGSPAGNYMTWDGVFLKLKGSFDVGTSGLINNASYTVANMPVAPTVIGFNSPSAFE